MEEKIPLTSFAHKILSERQKEIGLFFSRKRKPTIENQRKANALKDELAEINSILKDSFVRDFDEKNPAQVQIGSVVKLENLITGDKREYTILTRFTSDPLKGVISNESPLAQKMLGLKLGNTFKFRNSYGKEDS